MLNSVEEINISWEGPFTHSEIMNETSNEQTWSKNKRGLYQIYGNHPLYGLGVLLYIGLTIDSFQSRLKNRWVIEDGNDTNNIAIYLGTIYSASETLVIEKEISQIIKAEALLINAHKPAFNSSYINSVKQEFAEDNFTLFNKGSYRSLFPEVSSRRWWHETNKNFEITEKLAKSLDQTLNYDDDFFGFDLKENDNICFGVDYAYWDDTNIPLVIGIYKKSRINEEELRDEFLSVGGDKDYYFIGIPDAMLNADNVLEQMEVQLNKVKKY